MDPNKPAPAWSLPGELGLTEGQAEECSRIVRQALEGKKDVSVQSYIGWIRSMLEEPAESIRELLAQGLEDEYSLLMHQVAHRALALGIQIGKAQASTEPTE